MIAIITKTVKQFSPSYVGYIKLEIIGIYHDPRNKIYQLTIEESCIVEEAFNNDPKDIRRMPVGNRVVRNKTLSYVELAGLAKVANIDLSNALMLPESLDMIYRHGLLLKTQQESQNGEYPNISPEEWEILE